MHNVLANPWTLQVTWILLFTEYITRATFVRFRFEALHSSDVVRRYVAFQLGSGSPARLGPGVPPVALRVVQDLQQIALLEAQIFVGARVVVVQRHERLHGRVLPRRTGRLSAARRRRGPIVRRRPLLADDASRTSRCRLLLSCGRLLRSSSVAFLAARTVSHQCYSAGAVITDALVFEIPSSFINLFPGTSTTTSRPFSTFLRSNHTDKHASASAASSPARNSSKQMYYPATKISSLKCQLSCKRHLPIIFDTASRLD